MLISSAQWKVVVSTWLLLASNRDVDLLAPQPFGFVSFDVLHLTAAEKAFSGTSPQRRPNRGGAGVCPLNEN